MNERHPRVSCIHFLSKNGLKAFLFLCDKIFLILLADSQPEFEILVGPVNFLSLHQKIYQTLNDFIYILNKEKFLKVSFNGSFTK